MARLRQLAQEAGLDPVFAEKVLGFIIAEVIDRLSKKKKRQASTVIAVNAVQEEIGGNGAAMVAHRLVPDLAIVLDVTHATDSPAKTG